MAERQGNNPYPHDIETREKAFVLQKEHQHRPGLSAFYAALTHRAEESIQRTKKEDDQDIMKMKAELAL